MYKYPNMRFRNMENMYDYAPYMYGMPCMYPSNYQTTSNKVCPMNPYMRCPMDYMQMPTSTYQNYSDKDNCKFRNEEKNDYSPNLTDDENYSSKSNNFKDIKMRTVDINDIID